MSLPSPSDDNSPIDSQEFINVTRQGDRDDDSSPRTELLSQSSQQSGFGLPTALETRRRSRRSRTVERRRRERELAHSSMPQRDLIRLLVDQEYEASKLRQALYSASQQIESESRRLEQANGEATQRFRLINDARITAEQEASKVNQELSSYKFQLENAQNELSRAQETIRQVEKQRDDAEAVAARARNKARKLNQQWLIEAAREEGRRFGFEVGFNQAQQEHQTNLGTINELMHHPSANDIQNRDANVPYEAGSRVFPPLPQNQQLDPIQESVEAVNPDQSSTASSTISGSLRNGNTIRPTQFETTPIPHAQPHPINEVFTAPHISVPQTQPDFPLSAFSQPPPPQPVSSQPPSLRYTSSQTIPLQTAPQPAPPQTAPPQTAPTQRNQSQSQSHREPKTPTPSVQVFTVDIPSPEEIERNNLVDIIPRNMPRSEWVTAQQFGQMHSQGQNSAQSGPSNRRPQASSALKERSLNNKGVKFKSGILSRPSIAKTKEQAASWYRSLSFRRKNRPALDIDPIEEKEDPPSAASSDSEKKVYQFQPPSRQSWYHDRRPASSRSRNHTHSRSRATSLDSVSTRMSQLELVKDPHKRQSRVAPPAAGSASGGSTSGNSVKSKKLREKDRVLSVIKEDTTSRGNTPITDRFFTTGARKNSSSEAQSIGSGGFIPQPNFVQNAPNPLSMSGQHAPMDRPPPRQFQRPKNLTVPSPLAPPNANTNGDHQRSLGAIYNTPREKRRPGELRLSGRLPTSTSEMTTPGIDIVPPSESPSDGAPRMPSADSDVFFSPIHHLQSFSTSQLGTTAPLTPRRRRHALSPAGSDASSQISLLQAHNFPTGDVDGTSLMTNNDQPPVPFPTSSPRMGSRHSRSPPRISSAKGGSFPPTNAIDRLSHVRSPSLTPRGMREQPLPQLSRPESIRSSASRKQTVVNAGMTPAATYTLLPSRKGKSLSHAISSTSVRSNYSSYDPLTYLDPSAWVVDAGGTSAQAQNDFNLPRLHSRAASTTSDLSYL